ncbi:hypothetical protein P5V15_004232 [Pogonomyrmex californicus]
MKRVTLEKVIAFLKIELMFACCWPVSRDATKCQIVCDKIFRLVSALHAILLVIEIMYTLIYRIDDVRMFMQSSCLMVVILEVPVQILLYTLQHDRLQEVIFQMEDYYRHSKLEERDIFQKFIDKHIKFYAIILGVITAALATATLGPMFKDSFPIVIKYPFHVEQQPLHAIIYLHHSFGIYQSYCQRLPLSVKVEFVIGCMSSLGKVFLSAWPADYLMAASSDIGDAAYDSLWYEHGTDSQKIILYTLLRCQRPVIITVPGLLKALSFQHYSADFECSRLTLYPVDGGGSYRATRRDSGVPVSLRLVECTPPGTGSILGHAEVFLSGDSVNGRSRNLVWSSVLSHAGEYPSAFGDLFGSLTEGLSRSSGLD